MNPTTIRIAVDGAPGAGKTTTTRALGERLGQPVLSPSETAEGRTQLFDWLDYAGGSHRGQAIRTQVIAVPGHDEAKRLTILDLADVVLFVADSTPDGIFASAEAFRELQTLRSSADLPPALVIQANKRDAADAHEVDELRALFEVTDDVAVVETVASTGDGVQKAFVYAVRSGLARLADDPDPPDDLTPSALEARLLGTDPHTDPVADEPVDDGAEPAATAGARADATPDEVIRHVLGGPADEVMEIVVPPEDQTNPEPFELLDAPDADHAVVEAAAVTVANDPTPPQTDDANPFGHLPPPPSTPATKGRWRRRRTNPEAVR